MEHANPPDCTRDEASSPNPYIVLNDPDSTAEIPSETPVNPSSEVEKPSDGRWKPSRGGKKRKLAGIMQYMAAQQKTASESSESEDCNNATSASAGRHRKRDHKKEASQRKVVPAWFTKFPWLRQQKGTNVLYCVICSVNGSKMLSFAGYKSSVLEKHQKSDTHNQKDWDGRELNDEDATETKAMAGKANGSMAEGQTTLPEAVESKAMDAVLKKEFDNKRIQFISVFNLLKHHKAMTDYEIFQDTMRAHPDYASGFPIQHTSDNSGWGMADAINNVLAAETKKRLLEADFFSLSIDGSAAIDNTDYLNIESRVWHEGKLHLAFISMEDIGSDPSAAGQEKTLLRGLTKFLVGDWESEAEYKDNASKAMTILRQNLVAVAADGCAAMQGDRGGLLRLVQNKIPHLLKIRCCAHNVNLAAGTLDKEKVFRRISEVVKGVATFFNRSPKRCARLKEIQRLIGVQNLMPITVNDTRWMPIYKSMVNLLKILPAVLLVMVEKENKEDLMSKSLVAELTSVEVLLGMYCYEPLLAAMERLTKVVQSSNLYPGDVSAALCQCKISIQTTYRRDAEETMKIKFRDLYKLTNFEVVNGLKFKAAHGKLCIKAGGVAFPVNENELPTAEGVPIEYLPKIQLKRAQEIVVQSAYKAGELVKDELKIRFPTIKLMDALGIVTLRYWLQLQDIYTIDPSKIINRGRKDLDILIYQFGKSKMDEDGDDVEPRVDSEKLVRQYMDFYSYMMIQAKAMGDAWKNQDLSREEVLVKGGGEDVEFFWRREHIPDNISEFKKLVHLILCIPFGSVENERRFSAMNLVSTKLRNRLKADHLNTCLRIAATTWTAKTFNYEAAFMDWKGLKQRRGLLRTEEVAPPSDNQAGGAVQPTGQGAEMDVDVPETL